ncbi:MAG: amino acid permease, partial [Bacteroidetes bacterium]|nr:amino acid permease [Bacteroidota bacterium]
ACVLVLSGTYDELITYVVFSSFVFYGLSAAGLFILRRRASAQTQSYSTWGYPLTPALFVTISAALVINTIVESPSEAAVGAVIIMTGIPAFFLSKKISTP